MSNNGGDPERDQALQDYKKSLLESREWESKLKSLRLGIKDLQKEFDTTEENIKALQSVGQIIGEVLKQLDDERCECDRHVDLWRVSKSDNALLESSYRQSLIRPALRCRMPFESRQSEAEARNSRHT
jgi:ATP-dependent 26S proteasome regulatory subunit